MAEVKLVYCFVVVLNVFMAAHFCYAGNEVLKHLNRLNKRPVKSIKSPDGDTIDCVHISHQLAFDHPLLKNHTIKTRPSYHPHWVKDDNINMNASKVGPLTTSTEPVITQLWHSNGKCPEGTIPVIRTTSDDVLRSGSIKSYGKKKKSFPVAQLSSMDSKLMDPTAGHEYAHALSDQGLYYGAKATFNLWNPKVQETNEFSLGQLWILAGNHGSDLNTIEAGWQVSRQLYGDSNTRLFIYWTRDYYQTTGCYNHKCPGFIQTNNVIALGGTLSPTSQIGGTQYEITILIWRDKLEKVWWMQLNGIIIGYWPAALFTRLSASASALDFGGEVINIRKNGQHTTTQMGSGRFPQEGFGKASYIKNIQQVDANNILRPLQKLNFYTPQKSCYDLVSGTINNWGSYFFYGGPGRNLNCP